MYLNVPTFSIDLSFNTILAVIGDLLCSARTFVFSVDMSIFDEYFV
jgi:hypothetical protein